MIDKMKIQKFYLYREGFAPLVIRKITMVDESYYFEMLAYSHPHYICERWEKLNLSNKQIEDQINKYSQFFYYQHEDTGMCCRTQSSTPPSKRYYSISKEEYAAHEAQYSNESVI